AIYSAARYLAASGGQTVISRAIFSYNHAQWYVDEVLSLARLYGNGGAGVAFSLDRLQVRLQAAEQTVTKQNRIVVRATLLETRLARRSRALYARVDRAKLLSNRLDLEKRAYQMDARRAGAALLAGEARRKLQAAEQTLSKAR